MGLTRNSMGKDTSKDNIRISEDSKNNKVIALAGNPNVGKSTIFNALTGLNQHTGNWPGKTVVSASGEFSHKEENFTLVDLPGTYSIMASSVEEEVARDFICFAQPDLTVVVADATCLERNLNLVLQILEITNKVVLCVNLLDEAKHKKISIDLDELSLQLGIPVVGTSARQKNGLDGLKDEIYSVVFSEKKTFTIKTQYNDEIEKAIELIAPETNSMALTINSRWLSIRLLENDESLTMALKNNLNIDVKGELKETLYKIGEYLKEKNWDTENIRNEIVGSLIKRANDISSKCVHYENNNYNERDRKIDKILTSKLTGIPIMLLLLGFILWLTIVGANYPSEVLAEFLFFIQDKLTALLKYLNAPEWVNGLFIEGMYKTLAWVVSVMLPPMAIFFPLFTILEDSGYLPRIAFNMDKCFKRAGAHGKQSLTMCMGFGCNACGVVGCRIIDSPRERLIAIVTNNFVPCNGRFPTLIAIISMFFTFSFMPKFQSFFSTLILLSVVLLGILMTLMMSKLLSKTLLKGFPSSFALELPPYRKVQFGKVIVHSIFDRTLFVLGRAICVAAPAGILIWLLSNIFIGDVSLLIHCANFLDPFARLIGLDGVILFAFILGLPANEIVIPIIIMAYMATGSITGYQSLTELHTLFVENGWTWVTALCVMLFSLFHFPCATTCLTIKKETQSIKWTLISFLLPTVVGIIVCFLVSNLASLLCN